MTVILIGTDSGCRTFDDSSEGVVELSGRRICAMAAESALTCLALIDDNEVRRRHPNGEWTRVLTSSVALESLLSSRGRLFGSTAGPHLVRLSADGVAERLSGFDATPGRSDWFAQGPPLGIRSMTATADGGAIMAAVHVGGIPRSADGGQTWAPTIPIMHDVHEVQAHSSLPNIVAAAVALGLCVSEDGGLNWRLLADGLEETHGLAVAILEHVVLFSVQHDPFTHRSQIWRWRIGGNSIEHVRDGLPDWLDGKVDTGHIAAGNNHAAIVDSGGSLWFSSAGATAWKHLATGIHGAYQGMVVL